eukprot:SAG22_NODE_15074_length_358_cov_0.444015_1_plen_101_part_10
MQPPSGGACLRLGALSAAAALVWARGSGALDNGLASRPPMGFNTWNGLTNAYNETVIIEVIDSMAAQLLPHGYRYVVLTEQGMPTIGPHGTGRRMPNDTVF